MKAKNILLSVAAVAIVCTLSVGLYSCSSDDDGDGGGKASTSAGVLDKRTGLRITSYGSTYDTYRVYYLDDGRIDYIKQGSYEQYKFSYSPNRITAYYGSEEEEVLNIGYNGSGYISSIKSSYSGEGSGERWTETSNATLSYDSNGHLTKISVSGNETSTDMDTGERTTEKWTGNYTLLWRNNLLMQVVVDETEIEGGEKETETETWVFSYDNSSYENVYCQWTPSISSIFGDGIVEMLANLGLLGTGPIMLPSSGECHEESYYNGSNHSYDRSYTYRYGFNSDGSLSSATVSGTTYRYSYDYAV